MYLVLTEYSNQGSAEPVFVEIDTSMYGLEARLSDRLLNCYDTNTALKVLHSRVEPFFRDLNE